MMAHECHSSALRGFIQPLPAPVGRGFFWVLTIPAGPAHAPHPRIAGGGSSSIRGVAMNAWRAIKRDPKSMNEPLHLRLSDEVLADLEYLAALDGRKPVEVAREIITAFFNGPREVRLARRNKGSDHD